MIKTTSLLSTMLVTIMPAHMPILTIFLGLCAMSLIGAKQPNVVLILADDYGYNDIGYHNPDILTPHMDRLAGEGVILEQSYVQPVCTPTRWYKRLNVFSTHMVNYYRSALMTGLYPFRLGRQGVPIANTMPTGLTLEKKLLPEYLKDLGYKTHLVGKWHLGFCKEEFLPTNRGFDSHQGFWSGYETYYSKVVEDEMIILILVIILWTVCHLSLMRMVPTPRTSTLN